MLLSQTHPLNMRRGDVEESLDGQGHISGVVQLEFVRDLGIGKVLEEPLILVLSDLSLVSIPYCLQVIDELAIELDWICDE